VAAARARRAGIVVAAQTAESRPALRAASLLAVLVSAKAITLLGHHVPLSWWSPFAYLWQDVSVAVLFFLIDRSLGRPAPAWGVYGLLVAYTALNVPIVLVLSTPLTWTMLRAARGPLSDAVLHYLTAANLAGLIVPLVTAVSLPLMFRHRAMPMRLWVVAAAAAIVAIGPFAVSRVETNGLHRNAFGALVATSLPRVESAPGVSDWRATDQHGPQTATDEHRPTQHEDLSSLRGSMKGRNVILAILESTGARHLGVYGGSPDPTPNLSAFARRSIVFERAYAVYPESIKGLFATLCSRYPAFDTPPELYAGAPCTSLPGTLSAAGYRTALFHSGRFDYLGMKAIVGGRGFERLEDAGAIGGQVNSSFGVDDASTVRRALEWIRSLRKGERFFLTYLPVAGHSPYEVTRPGPFAGRDDFTRYLNALHEGDEAFGELLGGLRAQGLQDDTVVIVAGDHGEAFGEHPGNFAHTMFIYEENVRVPYMIAAPGAVNAPLRVQRLASIIDTAPTILDLLGLPAEALHQGTSLLRPEPRMALFLTDYSIGWLGLADGCWKYLYDMDANRSRLFDVCDDPGETRDRARELTERASAYQVRVREWAAAQKDAMGRGTR
jgi:phosphoglycerol transferase MdoB-like AlkP superfamily enzyme